MSTQFGKIEEEYVGRYSVRYSIELWHEGLSKHRLIRSDDKSIVLAKARLQAEEWDRRWALLCERANSRSTQAANKANATARTQAAQAELAQLGSLLEATLSVNDAIDWSSLKSNKPFAEPIPTKAPTPDPVPEPVIAPEPQSSESRYRPSFSILALLSSSRRAKAVDDARARFDADHSAWYHDAISARQEHASQVEARQRATQAVEDAHRDAQAIWSARKQKHEESQREANAVIDKKAEAHKNCTPAAVVEYSDLVLAFSKYPSYFAQEYELNYVQDSKTIIVDYALPPPNSLPSLKSVKYVESRKAFEEQNLSPPQQGKLYDDVLYQVTLRTIHELFESDTVGAIQCVVFNGYVTSIDPRIGKNVTNCILSVRTARDEFMSIDLANVDPRSCFKALKGVGSSKLHGLAAVAPVMSISREDSRFVAANNVASGLNDGTNLATIDWQDFEHLIRELFEREFSANGAEVKVTRASRDGGVDVVAFDPDPIRGGKIIVQAKRYTHTVGVSAVRDLYGTVLNEGATKGILVTTSDFGPDSYEFAKAKPLVLMNGANLLHLLERQGHKVRIDLKEAKGMV